MKFYPILLSFSLLSCLLSAQTRTTDGRVNFIGSGDRFQFVNPFDEREVGMRGTRFFLDSMYRPGELKTTKNLYTTEMLYRFDQIERTVQVRILENGKEMFLSEKDVIYVKINYGDHTVQFVNASVPNGYASTLVQVVYQTPTLQLLRDSRKFIFKVKSDNIDGYSSEQVYNEVRKDYRFFLSKGTGKKFVELKPDAKTMIKIFPEKKALITRLFKAAESKGGMTLTKLAGIMKELDVKETQ